MGSKRPWVNPQPLGTRWRVITKERFNVKYQRGIKDNPWGPTDWGPEDAPLKDFEWIYDKDMVTLLEWRFLEPKIFPIDTLLLDPAAPFPVGLPNVAAGNVVSVAIGDVSTNVVNVTGANVVKSTSATTVGLAELSTSTTIAGGTTAGTAGNAVIASAGGIDPLDLSASAITVPSLTFSSIQAANWAGLSASATIAGGTTAGTAGNAVIASAGGIDPLDLSASAITVPSLTFSSIQAANWAGLSASATIAGGTTGAVSWNTVNAADGTSGTNTGLEMPFLLTIPYTVAFIEQISLQLSSSAIIPSANATSSSLGSIGSTPLTIPAIAPEIDFLAVRNVSAIPVSAIPETPRGFGDSAVMGVLRLTSPPILKIFWERPDELPKLYHYEGYDQGTTQQIFFDQEASPLRAFRISSFIDSNPTYGPGKTIIVTPSATEKFDIFTYDVPRFRSDLPNASDPNSFDFGIDPIKLSDGTHFIIPIENDTATIIKLETPPWGSEPWYSLSILQIDPATGEPKHVSEPPFKTQTVIQRNPKYDSIGTSSSNDLHHINGSDTFLWGGGGKDTLTGGSGSDVFAFRYGDSIYADLNTDGNPDEVDVIKNFQFGKDKILVFAPDLKHDGPDDYALGLQITPMEISKSDQKSQPLGNLITDIEKGLKKNEALLLTASDGNFIILPSPIQKDDHGFYRDPYGSVYSYNDPGPKHLNPLVIKVESSDDPFKSITPSDYFL